MVSMNKQKRHQLLVVGVGEDAVADGEFHDLPAVYRVALAVGSGIPVVGHSFDEVKDDVGELVKFALAFADDLPLTDLALAIDHKGETDTEETVFGTFVGEGVL